MSTRDVDRGPSPVLWRTRDLLAAGMTERSVPAAVADGNLRRLRQGAFCHPSTDPRCAVAGEMHGRLTCVSELKRRGVFVLEPSRPHVHVPSTSARVPSVAGVTIHRKRLRRTPHPRALSVEVFDALLQAVLCQPPRAALATIDSALHHQVVRLDELDELFDHLPRRYRSLRRLVDSRAESGPETLMRLILRALRCHFEVQVSVDGVGRVDFLVDGWLVIECDSEEFHAEWEAQLTDRRRDAAAAARGLVTLRFVAEDVMWHPDRVRDAVRGLLEARVRRPRVGNAG